MTRIEWRVVMTKTRRADMDHVSPSGRSSYSHWQPIAAKNWRRYWKDWHTSAVARQRFSSMVVTSIATELNMIAPRVDT